VKERCQYRWYLSVLWRISPGDGGVQSLANVVWVVYFDVDEKENYQWKAMEWAHP